MLRRLLIANRGEIVCRIARTAQRMGVTAIAVYSDADRNALHVRVADEAYYLGPSPAVDSYLDIAKIIALAQSVRADAVHPGYGFLSENAAFAQACVDAGLIFVGPPAAAIKAMGSKSASKAAMAKVGVPVAPGYHGDDQSPQRLADEASRVGFPLIIKASAGGGGKGMQVVHEAGDVAAAVESARRLARTAFGDDRLLLERYFAQARHVEVQIFADAQGACVSLFDRDCSVQRRHQKIIEEAPAPGIRVEVRDAMGEAAVRAARAVDYVGAGTVEFLVDEAQNFYFMEMNTRLQVEHPVTEFITGIDLVEWQLRIARGEPLPQQPITQRGCAVEARLYAEDPGSAYLPSVGRITHLRWPTATAGVRVDSGVEAGDDVSKFYDPMLGKVIAWADSRSAAIQLLHRALTEIELVGVTSNLTLLKSVLLDDRFVAGAVGTDFLDAQRSELRFSEADPAPIEAALAAVWLATRCTAENAPWGDTTGWRLSFAARSTWRFSQHTASVECTAPDRYLARVGGEEFAVRVLARDADSLQVDCNGRIQPVHIVDDGIQLHLFRAGRQASLRLVHTDDALQADVAAEQGSLLTPLPGTVVAVHVAVGQAVTRGAPLITVEAMKMEHTLTAPYAGVVSKIAHAVKDRVAAGAVLVELSGDLRVD